MHAVGNGLLFAYDHSREIAIFLWFLGALSAFHWRERLRATLLVVGAGLPTLMFVGGFLVFTLGSAPSLLAAVPLIAELLLIVSAIKARSEALRLLFGGLAVGASVFIGVWGGFLYG